LICLLQKKLLEKNVYKNKKNYTRHNKLYKDSKINKLLIDELRNKKFRNVLFYYPMNDEANVIKSLKQMRKNYKVYVPFMQGESFKMVPFRLPLKKNRFGIFEAGKTLQNINKIDIAIVPAVGVDVNMQRIGFGKGMYDRFFARLNKKPYTIFVQSDLCMTKYKVCDDYDVACDVLLTHSKRILAHRWRKDVK
jgi:5-formyltetrahydrofolate cyclo-ligase